MFMIQNQYKIKSLFIQFKIFSKMIKTINTISAYRSLLQQEDYQIKAVGLKQLLNNISLHWADIANDLTLIQELADDPKMDDHELVCMLLSKLYFYLNSYDESLDFALRSGTYFNIEANDEFTETLVNKCIEKYIQAHREKKVDAIKAYASVVQKMISASLEKGDNRLVLGVTLQTNDLQLFKRVLKNMDIHELIENVSTYILNLDVAFRLDILKQILAALPSDFNEFIEKTSPIQYINLLFLLYVNNNYQYVSKIIYELVKKNQKEIAYTLALEISQMQGFNKKVLSAIPIQNEYEKQRKDLQYIIEGRFSDEVQNVVLKNQAKTDPHYLEMLKKVEAKNSISHGSAIMALSMLQAFTQDDSFLQIKENFEWASKATHWNKFTTIASLGLIFRNMKNKSIFNKFLPESNADVVNHYPNGGALYGLGLLFTGTMNQQIIDYIISITTNPTHNQNEVIMHGACLGLGLTAFASGNETIGERLKDILRLSTSIMGEASALAIGLTYAGTNNEPIISELLGIAQETEHEKITRSICLSIAIISFQNPNQQFLANLQNNPSVKLTLPLYLACAYFKTSNPTVVKKLLKLSNDISNEVKRTAIICLGFVMYHDEKLYDVIKMLLYSYNPYIRYGCVMALAIGAKETKDALQLIWPLLTDSVDFVRQGVYVALSILFQVATTNSEPKLADFRKTIEEIIGKSHVEVMAKFGAIVSVGLLDIGGRNMCVSLTTRSGLPKMEAVVGMLIFSQYWNWFPFLNFIGLALTPAMYIGVTTDFKIPKSFQLKSNCKPSLFDYPANIVKQEKKNDNKKDVAKELSTTNKTKVRLAIKKKQEMEIQIPVIKKPSLISHIKQPIRVQSAKQKEIIEENKQKQKEKQQKKQEESFSILNNPARVAQKQKKYIQFIDRRYTPIINTRKSGISFLKDNTPGEKDDYLELAEKEKMEIEKKAQKPQEKVEEKKPEAQEKKDQMEPEQQFEYDEQAQLLKKKQ